MLAVLCITLLVYLLSGKDTAPVLDKLRRTDWRGKAAALRSKIEELALRSGRTAARPLLRFLYVLDDERTTTAEKAMLYGAILYIVLPVSLLPRRVFHLAGLLDECAVAMFVHKKIRDRITPDIEAAVESTLDRWFAPKQSATAAEKAR